LYLDFILSRLSQPFSQQQHPANFIKVQQHYLKPLTKSRFGFYTHKSTAAQARKTGCSQQSSRREDCKAPQAQLCD